jgi:hypothetical protein
VAVLSTRFLLNNLRLFLTKLVDPMLYSHKIVEDFLLKGAFLFAHAVQLKGTVTEQAENLGAELDGYLAI